MHLSRANMMSCVVYPYGYKTFCMDPDIHIRSIASFRQQNICINLHELKTVSKTAIEHVTKGDLFALKKPLFAEVTGLL